MQDNKDRLQAHLYLAKRLRSAMVAGDPNLLHMPMVRTRRGMWWGVALCALLFAGFALYGVIRPGGRTGWAIENAIVVEKESGARFLFLDGALHPTLNYSSALLAGGDPATVQRVARASMSDVERGATIGIPGAPDALPTATEIDDAEWAVCATESDDQTPEPTVSLVFGAGLDGAALSEGEALLVRPRSDDTVYLVTRFAYHRIESDLVRAALGFDASAVHEVESAWLNALPEAAPIELPAPGQSGGPVSLGDGSTVEHGQVLRVELVDGTPRHYLAVDGGLAPVTEFTAALLAVGNGSGGTTPGITGAELSAVASAPESDRSIGQTDWPETVPALQAVDRDQALCTHFDLSNDEAAGGVSTLMTLPPDGLSLPVPADAVSDRTADRIITLPNAGALLRSVDGGGRSSAWFLVTENGVKYPIPTAEDLAVLGYGSVDVDLAPNELLDFLPTGPGLDGADARLTVPVDSRRT